MTRAILLAVLGTLLCPGVSLADPVSTVRITDSGLPLSGGTLTGSITAPNVTATSTVSGATVTASGTVSGSTVSATTLTGTLSTAAQPNVTSVGTLSSLTLGGTLDLGMFALKDPGNIYRLQATTDAAPISRSFSAQAAFEQATGANQVGASRMLAGGIGTRQITTFNSGATGADTYTGTVTDQTGTVLSSVVLTRGVTFACVTDGPTCAAAFAVALNNSALGTEGVLAVCTGGTTPTAAHCTDSAVYLRFDPTKVIGYTHAIVDVGGGGVFGASVSGQDGYIKTNGQELALVSSTTAPAYSFSAAPLSGVHASSNYIYLYNPSGVPALYSGLGSTVLSISLNANGNVIDDGLGCLSLGAPNGIALYGSGSHGDSCFSGSGSTKGQGTKISSRSQELTCANSATLTTTSALIPQYALVLGVTTRISSALTGPTGYNVGDGSNANRYGTTAAATLGTTTANPTAEPMHTAFAAAETVTITFAGGNCAAGKVFVTAHWIQPFAATAN